MRLGHNALVAKQDFCPRLMVWQHLISIIDKEKILWGRNLSPTQGQPWMES
jgi:hypothetical protein